MNKPELETLNYRPSKRVNKADNASQPEQPKEDKILICPKCDKMFPLYMQAEFAGHVAVCSYSKPEQPKEK